MDYFSICVISFTEHAYNLEHVTFFLLHTYTYNAEKDCADHLSKWSLSHPKCRSVNTEPVVMATSSVMFWFELVELAAASRIPVC